MQTRGPDRRKSDRESAQAQFIERLLDASDDCIKVLDLDARLVSMSANGLKALAIMNFASVAGTDWRGFWHGEDRLSADAAVASARAGGRGRFTGLYRVDGRERYWDVTVTAILGGDGRPERLLVVSRDVTERRAADRAVAEGVERVRLIASLHPGLLWTALPDGRLDHLSGTGVGEGLAIEERLGHRWLETVHADDRAAVAATWQTALQTGEPYEAAFRAIRADRSYRWMLARAVAQRDDDGRIVRWVGNSIDIDDQRRAYERERSIAVALQAAALPKRLPTVDHLTLSAAYRPGSSEATIGGDWYDAFVLDDGRVAFVIGDVLGNGLAAAVTMGQVRQAMRSVALVVPDPNAMLDVADRTIRAIADDAYATALAGVYDTAAYTFTYASAGHPGPIVRHADGRIDECDSSGLLLGMRPPGQTACIVRSVPPGSTLLFYTDGLSEATRDVDEGLQRIRAALADPTVIAAAEPAQALVAHVLGDAPAHDDIAVLIATIGATTRVV